MDAMTIVCIVIAAIVGGVITYFLTNKKKVNAGREQQLQAEKEQLAKECEQKVLEGEKKAEEIVKRYESLLVESKEQVARLDEQLKNCLDGNLDDVVKKELASVEKLKKQLKDLQEEMEDYEDDIDNYKKKLKKRDEENASLQDELGKEVKKSRQLLDDLEKVKSELEDKTQELNLKVESLYFVQEILSAKAVSDANTKELHSKVDNVCNFVSGELRDCVKSMFTVNNEEKIFRTGLEKWAATTKKKWIEGKISIAFVGEFSAGKTSIVNRILSQDNPDIPLLPVSTKATTAIPTYISGGLSTYYNFVTPDNVQKSISEDTFKRVNKEVLDQVKGVSSLIQYFVMTYKNENLNELSILDTPGFNSNDKEDAERTIEVINECDALFWVFDVNAGTVNRSSISLIKKNLKKPLFVVINKVDTKAETEVNKVEQLIRKTLRDEGVDVQKFIRFSAKSPLNDIMMPIKSVTRDSSQDSYIHNLTEFVDSLVKDLYKDEQKANQNQTLLFKKCDSLTDQYNRTVNLLGQNCQEVADIPHWEEHLFSKDRYEMSEYEYNRLVDLLNTICVTRMNELADFYNRQMQAREEAQDAYRDYFDKKANWQKMNSCKEQLNKYIKALKN